MTSVSGIARGFESNIVGKFEVDFDFMGTGCGVIVVAAAIAEETLDWCVVSSLSCGTPLAESVPVGSTLIL